MDALLQGQECVFLSRSVCAVCTIYLVPSWFYIYRTIIPARKRGKKNTLITGYV